MLERGLLWSLVELVQTYFNFMLGYVELRPYVPPTQYDERKELDFRAIFLKVYRAQRVTLASGSRVLLVAISAGLTKSGASHMKITKGKTTVYVPDLSDQEKLELPTSWNKIAVPNKEDPMNLFVGAYSWWGKSDKIAALDSPQKGVSTGGNCYV